MSDTVKQNKFNINFCFQDDRALKPPLQISEYIRSSG